MSQRTLRDRSSLQKPKEFGETTRIEEEEEEEEESPPPKRQPRRRAAKSRQDTSSSSEEGDEQSSTEESQEESSSSGEPEVIQKPVRRSNRPVQLITRFQPGLFRKPGSSSRSPAKNRHGARGRLYLSSSTSSDSDEYARQTRLTEANMIPINDPERNLRADVTPLEIDESVDWDKVGGLDQHINALKEMVMFPLMYPELFERFSVTPPKGVLFYGPPGTGKTLVARALANTCSKNGRKVSFFMRKGADILSKWVGEAERQLRLLFEQAKRMQPSIIFFDEIDGLAPIRSSRQDQIHSSIVSTLLALMDGLDNRGQVVVIGATNRIDHIDPGLRRPGRFDREFLFTLPTAPARKSILDIHTASWNPGLPELLKETIAEKCVGYCGADLKALCTEASLKAIRRHYPQIYQSDQKLVVRPQDIKISLADFINAMNMIVPSSHRMNVNYSRSLLLHLKPLLGAITDSLYQNVTSIMPNTAPQEEAHNANDDDLEFSLQSIQSRFMSTVYRPRLLICSDPNMCQAEIVADLLHRLESLPIHNIDMASLHSDSTLRSLEEALVCRFKEAMIKLPSIVFLPHFDGWWSSASESLHQTLIHLLNDLDPTVPLFFLAVSDCRLAALRELTGDVVGQIFEPTRIVGIPQPSDQCLANFWELLKAQVMVKPKPKRHLTYPKLPLAPVTNSPIANPFASPASDEYYQRKLRENLRNIIARIKRNRRYEIFIKPINETLFHDYFAIVVDPVDLNTLSDRVDSRYYRSYDHFREDIDLMIANTKSYYLKNQNKALNKASELDDYVASLYRRLDQRLVDSTLDSSTRTPRGPKIAFENPTEEEKSRSASKKGKKRNRRSSRSNDRSEGRAGLNGKYWNRIQTKDSEGNIAKSEGGNDSGSQEDSNSGSDDDSSELSDDNESGSNTSTSQSPRKKRAAASPPRKTVKFEQLTPQSGIRTRARAESRSEQPSDGEKKGEMESGEMEAESPRKEVGEPDENREGAKKKASVSLDLAENSDGDYNDDGAESNNASERGEADSSTRKSQRKKKKPASQRLSRGRSSRGGSSGKRGVRAGQGGRHAMQMDDHVPADSPSKLSGNNNSNSNNNNNSAPVQSNVFTRLQNAYQSPNAAIGKSSLVKPVDQDTPDKKQDGEMVENVIEEDLALVVEETEPLDFEITIDKTLLDSLFAKILKFSSFSNDGMNVEKILSLHVSLMNDIAGEINNADKTGLLKKMNATTNAWIEQ